MTPYFSTSGNKKGPTIIGKHADDPNVKSVRQVGGGKVQLPKNVKTVTKRGKDDQ